MSIKKNKKFELEQQSYENNLKDKERAHQNIQSKLD